jgi:hypothetical protein
MGRPMAKESWPSLEKEEIVLVTTGVVDLAQEVDS